MDKKCIKCGKEISREQHITDAAGNDFCIDCLQTKAQQTSPAALSTTPLTVAQPIIDHSIKPSSPAPKQTNLLGTLSFTFSLLSLLSVFAPGLAILVPIGFVLGVLGMQVQPRGFALAGTITNGLLIGLAILSMFFLSSDLGPRDIPDRTSCSMNIRSAIQSMTIYAQNNNGAFPYVSGPVTPDGRYGNSPLDLPANISGTPGALQNTKYVISQWYTNANSAATGAGSPLGSLWLLVMTGQDTPKTFICPSDPIANNASSEYGTVDGSYMGNFGFFMFGSDTLPNATGQGESYSICFPYAYKSNASAANPEVAGSWWVNDTRADQPIMSDMAPLSGVGSGTFYRDTKISPANNTYGPYIYNSGNHNGVGQNIGFADGHVEWDNNPYVGEQEDNIFTINNSKPFNPNAGGAPLTGTGTSNAGITSKSQPQSPPYDTVMVPVRNVQTGDW